jgi:hypothetical protein
MCNKTSKTIEYCKIFLRWIIKRAHGIVKGRRQIVHDFYHSTLSRNMIQATQHHRQQTLEFRRLLEHLYPEAVTMITDHLHALPLRQLHVTLEPLDKLRLRLIASPLGAYKYSNILARLITTYHIIEES